MKIDNILFCDDIRKEISNKFTLVGCYNDRILLNAKAEIKWPIGVKMGIYLRILREQGDPVVNKFKLELYDSQEALFTAEGELLNGEHNRPLILALVAPFAFKRPGPLRPIVTITGTDGSEQVLRTEFDFRLEIAQIEGVSDGK